jgi:hypothetical protein
VVSADKKVFPDFYVLGWYSTGSDVQDTDMLIHKAVSSLVFKFIILKTDIVLAVCSCRQN